MPAITAGAASIELFTSFIYKILMSEHEAKNAVKLTSLLLVEERFLEANYFVSRLKTAELQSEYFRYEFNAFISAARTVTFLLQKEMNGVPGFSDWWQEKQEQMRNDLGMRFFLDLRNYSQKEGRISIVSSNMFGDSWSYRLVSNRISVPDELLHREVWDCCADHLGKLARIVLRFADEFPIYSCPHRAITPHGLRELGFPPSEIGIALGIPEAFIRVAPKMSTSEYCRILRKHCDAVDFSAIRAIAQYTPQPYHSSDSKSSRFLKSMVGKLEALASKNQRRKAQRR